MGCGEGSEFYNPAAIISLAGREQNLSCWEWDHPLDGAARAPAKVVGMQGGSQGEVERGKEPRAHLNRLLSKQDSLDAPLEVKAEAEITLDVGEVWKQGMSWPLLMRVTNADVQDSRGPSRAVCGTAGLALGSAHSASLSKHEIYSRSSTCPTPCIHRAWMEQPTALGHSQ